MTLPHEDILAKITAALRWPEANHAERKSSLAYLLGWNFRRVRSLYEAQANCRLKNHEMRSLTELLFVELAPMPSNDPTSPTGAGKSNARVED